MSIRIYNPEELPFGLLSNNFEYKMTIDDEEWRNITQYIYTNLIPKENEYFRRIIKSLNYDQIPSKYSEFETIIKDNYIWVKINNICNIRTILQKIIKIIWFYGRI